MKEIRYAPWFRVLTVFGVLVFWGMAFIGWMAYRQEEAAFGLAAAGVTLGIGAYLLFALATSPQWVRFEQDGLVVQRWIGRQRIAYESITAVSPAYTHITITTQNGKVRLHKLFANDDARLVNALETHVPALQQRRAARLSATFPIVVTDKPTAPIFSGIVGLALAGFGAFTLWYAITGPDPIDAFQRWVMPMMGLLSLFFGGLFLYLLLWNYPRRTVFTAAQMRQHFLLRTTVQPMQGIIAFEPGHEVRTVRGVPRQVHHIVFRYDDGRSYKWVPGEFSFPVDYIDAYEAGRVAELTQQLRRAYLAPAAAAAQAIIERAKALPYDAYMVEFETLRDELNRLAPTAQATVLAAAREYGDHDIIDLLVTVLADNAYPPAMPMFVQWLDHPNDEVRFAAAIALDMVANGRFGIESMIEGGWVQHDQIRAAVPTMRAWWQEEGKEAVSTTAQWLAQQEAKRQ